MHILHNYSKKILKLGTKAILFVVLLVVVFSPVHNGFQPQVAHAAIPIAGADQAVGFVSNIFKAGGCINDFGNCVGGLVATIFYFIFVGLGSALAYLGAYVLSFGAHLTLQTAAYKLTFIGESWTQVRDLANMAFVFVLIYIAIAIMFRAETTNTLKTLAWVIAIALIVNFSFFLTRVVIDAGNIVAVQFYNSISSTGCSSTLFTNLCNTGGFKDLTSGIMDAIKIESTLSPDTLTKFFNSQQNSNWMATMIGFSFIYLCVGAVFYTLFTVFISVGIKFLVRIVLLWFAIILSPLALVARTLKRTESYYYLWQDMLVKNAFYPAFFFIIFSILSKITSTIAGDTNSVLNEKLVSATADYGASANFAEVAGTLGDLVVRVVFICLVIYVGLKFADKAGGYGAGIARKASSGASNFVFGATGFGLRNTLGYAGSALSRNTTLNNAAADSRVAAGLLRGAQNIGGSSFDLRNVRGARAGLTTLGDVDLKEGRGKGGFNASLANSTRKKEEFAKSLQPTAGQVAEAEQKVINSLSDTQKQVLKTAADNYAKAQKDFKDGLISAGERDKSKTEYSGALKSTGINEKLQEARKAAGAQNAIKYAERISTKGLVSTSDSEAAAQIRSGSSEAERFTNYLRKVQGNSKPATAATYITPPPFPAAPGAVASAKASMPVPTVKPVIIPTGPAPTFRPTPTTPTIAPAASSTASRTNTEQTAKDAAAQVARAMKEADDLITKMSTNTAQAAEKVKNAPLPGTVPTPTAASTVPPLTPPPAAANPSSTRPPLAANLEQLQKTAQNYQKAPGFVGPARQYPDTILEPSNKGTPEEWTNKQARVAQQLENTATQNRTQQGGNLIMPAAAGAHPATGAEVEETVKKENKKLEMRISERVRDIIRDAKAGAAVEIEREGGSHSLGTLPEIPPKPSAPATSKPPTPPPSKDEFPKAA